MRVRLCILSHGQSLCTEPDNWPDGGKALRDFGISAPIDVHLMVEPVDALIRMFADAGASVISFHPDASTMSIDLSS